MAEPIKLDFSKAVPVGENEGIKLDFSKAAPIVPQTETQFEKENKGFGRQFAHRMAETLPAAGAAIGGILGSGWASVPGAMLGGGAGKASQQLIDRSLGFDAPSTSTEAAKYIGIEGAKQGAYELGGKGAGKLVGKALSPVARKFAPELEKAATKYPILESLVPKSQPGKAVGHLTAAASTKGSAGPAFKAIEGSIGDIEGELTKLPRKERTVQAFLDSVSTAREKIHGEYESALAPHADDVIPSNSPILANISGVAKEWMDIPGMGQDEMKEIQTAIDQFQKPMTVGQLDSLRVQLNSDLATLFTTTPNAKYTALHKDITKAIDNAIVKGAREILYPIADQSTGKPAGYFASQLEKEGKLIQLRGLLQKRVDDLAGSQSISEVTPRLSSENLSLSGHPGSGIRAGFYGIRNVLTPPREMKAASSHVAKAFLPPQISSLPYEVLLANTPRAIELAKSHGDTEPKKIADFLK